MPSRRLSPAGGSAGGEQLVGYRIVVVASAAVSVVESAGGFLCDQVRRGWDVAALLTQTCDIRPLSILGVSAHVLKTDLGSAIRVLPRGTTVVAGADLLDGDARARAGLAQLAALGSAVTVCGRPAQTAGSRHLELTLHELSSAATAFKACALRAAGAPDAAVPVETLYRLPGANYRRLYSV